MTRSIDYAVDLSRAIVKAVNFRLLNVCLNLKNINCLHSVYCGGWNSINMSENSTTDEYAHVSKGPLKLKSDSAAVKKKKKKKQKEQKTVEMAKIIEEEKPKSVDLKRTKAELAFQKMQEKMQTERIKQKASMTHKQRVEEFNRHLDSLTEHFDIPKVSWTK